MEDDGGHGVGEGTGGPALCLHPCSRIHARASGCSVWLVVLAGLDDALELDPVTQTIGAGGADSLLRGSQLDSAVDLSGSPEHQRRYYQDNAFTPPRSLDARRGWWDLSFGVMAVSGAQPG